MGFDAAWLAARRPYDEAALDPVAIGAIQQWAVALPRDYRPVVVDLGSGTGAGLRRARRWLARRPVTAYAVDLDGSLLSRAAASACWHDAAPVVGDLLEPLAPNGGPPDGTVDLVVAHALADLVPLDRLAARAAALVRPGGLVHVALTYDGVTELSSVGDPIRPIGAGVEAAVLGSFHRHMDRPARRVPEYGGSTAGRRIGPSLQAAGFEIVVDAPSVWNVRASDGPGGRTVLAWLLRFILESGRAIGDVRSDDLDAWGSARRAALARRTLAARVGHRDVLARAPLDH